MKRFVTFLGPMALVGLLSGSIAFGQGPRWTGAGG